VVIAFLRVPGSRVPTRKTFAFVQSARAPAAAAAAGRPPRDEIDTIIYALYLAQSVF